MLGARVARHALRRNSADPGAFEVRILATEDFPELLHFDGRNYLREGRWSTWHDDDLQSFTPLRLAVPAEMGFAGRAILIDPDVFAVGDVNELFNRDMQGAAVLARRMEADSRRPLHYASSVMLLDCAQLQHWRWERDFGECFEGRRDYRDWMWLLCEPAGSVQGLPVEWNDFDRLTPQTRMLHNTHRRTQPWKTGLPADFTPRGTTWSSRAGMWLRRLGGQGNGRYRPHPDPAQERLFFTLLGELCDRGEVSFDMIEQEIAAGHLREDAVSCVERARNAAALAA